jgi:hypothetical protein
MNVSTGLHSYLEALLGKSPFQTYLGCWQNVFPCTCGTEGSSFLLIGGQPLFLEAACYQFLEANHSSLSCELSPQGKGI